MPAIHSAIVPGRPRPGAKRPEELRRRARRNARRGQWRKSAVALRELVALEDRPADWVRLGHALEHAGRIEDALSAYRQGLYLHLRLGAGGRARSVARIILVRYPDDPMALRLQAPNALGEWLPREA